MFWKKKPQTLCNVYLCISTNWQMWFIPTTFFARIVGFFHESLISFLAFGHCANVFIFFVEFWLPKKWCQWTFILFKWQALCTVILNTVNHSFNLSLFHSFFKAATSVLNIRIKKWQYVHKFPCHSQRKVSNKTI